MSIVWPCGLSVDAYAAAGRNVEVPRPDCPRCFVPMVMWSGYERSVREAGLCVKIFCHRARCSSCRVSDVLLPSFVLVGRLDVAETVGAVITAVVSGASGVRPVARAAEVPHTTARGWCWRFGARAADLAVSFAALSVEISGAVMTPGSSRANDALAAIRAAFDAACDLPGWLVLGLWRFASVVSGGGLIATNTNMPYLVIGKRRFMPPVP